MRRTNIDTDREPILRGATRADLPDICELERIEFRDLAWPYPMLRQFFDLHGPLWPVAETDEVVRGYALLGIGRARSNNLAAIRLYESAGFIKTGHEDDYFGTGEAREVMRRPIERPTPPFTEHSEDRWIKRPRPDW